MSNDENPLYCSFCNKSQHDVRELIRAPDDAAICDECINMCVIILREDGIETPGEVPNLQLPDFDAIQQALTRRMPK